MEEFRYDQVSTEQLKNLTYIGNTEIFVLRLDKIHSTISGNKWFKLKYYLEEATYTNKKLIITWGGCYSNHIVATAVACNKNKVNCIGIIRGERKPVLSFTLQKAEEAGMKLIFIKRKDYKLKKIPQEVFDNARIEETYIVNEGGYGLKGAIGAGEILDFCDKKNFSHIYCAVGTSTMMAGLIKASEPLQEIIGVSVLKNYYNHEKEVTSLLNSKDLLKHFKIIHGYHFGGYAKFNSELIEFMNELYKSCGIPTDFVYTGKLMYAVFDMVKKKYIPNGSRVLVIHSGGLQGNHSLIEGMLIF